MKKWETKETARDLRRSGLSYGEIREQIPVAKSTISAWCKDIKLNSAQLSYLNERHKANAYSAGLKGAKSNQLRRFNEIEKIKNTAISEISPLNNGGFKIAGLMLYWAEGYKSKKVGIANSDPRMISFMMDWFREVCKVPEEKFKLYMHLHSGQNELERKKFWAEITGIPFPQFGKSYVKKEGSGHRKNILYNGTLSINVCDRNLLHKILGWIEGVKRAASSSGRAPAS